MLQLEDSQVWESDHCVVQIQSMGKKAFDFRGVIFSKNKSGMLKFTSVIYNEKNRLEKFILSLDMNPVEKKIITKER